MIRSGNPSCTLLEAEEISGLNPLERKHEVEDAGFVSKTEDRSKSVPFELYKRRTTVVVRRETFLDIVCGALTEYKYVGHNQRADLVLACRYCLTYINLC